VALVNVSFFSNALMRQVNYSAIIPTDHPSFAGSLPTLYLLHGITGTHTSWILGSRIVQLASDHGVAVIMPSGDNSFYVDQEASQNYYGDYIGRELVSESRKLFPLSHRRDDTSVGGLSMGGYGALRNGLKYHHTFGAIIALSSALITERAVESTDEAEWVFARRSYLESVFGPLSQLEGSDKDVKALASRIFPLGNDLPRIYLACGTEDPLIDTNRSYRDHLERLGMKYSYVEGPGRHDWAFWDTYIDKALAWLLGGKVVKKISDPSALKMA